VVTPPAIPLWVGTATHVLLLLRRKATALNTFALFGFILVAGCAWARISVGPLDEVSGYYLVIGYPLACIPVFIILNTVCAVAMDPTHRLTRVIAILSSGTAASYVFVFLLRRTDLLR
jgi:hypothetical protein